MRVIVGLGNPEKDYKGTRHNIGFEAVNKLAYDHHVAIARAKFRAVFGEGVIRGQKVLLVKPQTYMNLSGESVRDILGYYKIPISGLVVVYDDTDLEPGQVRVRERGSAGGHNGMKNILYQLGTDEFPRVRVGIGQKPPGWDLADYVLARFRPEEQELMAEGVAKAAMAVETLLSLGAAAAMNQFNRVKRPVGDENGNENE